MDNNQKMPTIGQIKGQGEKYPVAKDGWCKINDKFCQTEYGCVECEIYKTYSKK